MLIYILILTFKFKYMTLAWIYLLIASIMEIGWPIGYKLIQSESTRIIGILMAAVCIIGSGVFLYIAQKTIPIGTAYAVWTGIGAMGTFIIGVLFFNEPSSMARWLGVILILSGVIVMKITSH